MLKKINDEKNIEELYSMIINVSKEISDVKKSISLLLDRVSLMEDKFSKYNKIYYEAVRKRCLNTELSLDRISDD